jgi:hypothetical protein
MESVASPFWKNPTNMLLAIGCVGIAGIATWMGFLTNKKDEGNQIKTQLGIVAAIVIILCFFFAVVSYIYFTSYPAYLTNFILVISFINLALSIFAVSAATINVSTF